MPIHLPAQNRRQFLFTVGAGLVACALDAVGSNIDGALVYLLNDTHIGEAQPPDSVELWEILVSRNHVKAYIHGHIHDRNFFEHEGIHILNMPATSYVADPKLSTTGWTVARLTVDGMTLTTRTTDAAHPWNGESKALAWRT